MIVSCDAKQLDWVCAVYLSKDKVGWEEIENNVDQHTLNQKEFDLPERKIAKFFLFRCIFKGSAYAFSKDPDFSWISSSQNYWTKRIDKFFNKYYGLAEQHEKWIRQVTQGKPIIIPTGRVFQFERVQTKSGEIVWPEKDIVCHPVQCLEAELMKEFRIAVRDRLPEYRPAVLFSSVHDDLKVDTPDKYVYNIKSVLEEEAANVPMYMKKYYNMDFNLPFRIEVSRGMNCNELEEF